VPAPAGQYDQRRKSDAGSIQNKTTGNSGKQDLGQAGKDKSKVKETGRPSHDQVAKELQHLTREKRDECLKRGQVKKKGPAN